MSDSIGFEGRKPSTTMQNATVEIFDPPMCCPTGMCGPTIDPVLLDVNEMIITLQGEGITVARYQMSTHAQTFARNGEVLKLLREKQLAALPISIVNGRIIKTGAYPTLTELRTVLMAETRAALDDSQMD